MGMMERGRSLPLPSHDVIQLFHCTSLAPRVRHATRPKGPRAGAKKPKKKERKKRKAALPRGKDKRGRKDRLN